MLRRDFLVRTGLAMGGALAAPKLARAAPRAASGARLESWAEIRSLFNLSRAEANFAGFFLASHPRPVRDAIDAHRRGFDENPVGYFFDNVARAEVGVVSAAADYLGVQPVDIALTDSTTMGLGLLYGGLKLRPGQDILTTEHDHYSTEQALRLRAERTGAQVRRIALYKDPAAANEEEIASAIARACRPETRVVAVTWVHSSTGVKLPIRRIADGLAALNAKRAEADRVLLCVDGVHGLGVENVPLPELGCDFFVAGTHKWMFGPRGTGLVWGRPSAWHAATATIPTFDEPTYEMWMGVAPKSERPPGVLMSPGGFHAFEHRWAVDVAFRLHQQIGKSRVEARIHELNRQL